MITVRIVVFHDAPTVLSDRVVGQITTVSKIRIYDPQFPSDALNNIRLSSASMDKLDNKIRELFTKGE